MVQIPSPTVSHMSHISRMARHWHPTGTRFRPVWRGRLTVEAVVPPEGTPIGAAKRYLEAGRIQVGRVIRTRFNAALYTPAGSGTPDRASEGDPRTKKSFAVRIQNDGT
jgi:hypothetical protein